ncbi:50S ribosomal protein L22 [bacterium]|jgi:large subunit ribosomal protein L22|nr:50S ribosomal protein L22 [bacterium]
MEASARSKYIRQSPTKLRIISELLVGKNVDEALSILDSLPNKGTLTLKKTINSALANAKQKKDSVDNFKIKTISVDEGPSLKRFRAATMGRAVTIKKRMSHLTVVLEDKSEPGAE